MVIFGILYEAMGLHVFSFSLVYHMIIRGIIVYFVGITLARFNKKLLGIRTPFNFILFVMLGSIFAMAIIDKELFLPIIGTMTLLMLLNGLVTMLAYYSSTVELFIKGSPSQIVKNGKIQWGAMQKNFITQRELFNEVHRQLHTRSLKEVESAFLTSDGSISFILQEDI